MAYNNPLIIHTTMLNKDLNLFLVNSIVREILGLVE